jgi:hypothetical protein
MDRLFPTPKHPIRPNEIYYAPPLIPAYDGKQRVEIIIRDGFARPADSDLARVAGPRLFYAPFWRVVLRYRSSQVIVAEGDPLAKRTKGGIGWRRSLATCELLLPALSLLPYRRVTQTASRGKISTAHQVERHALRRVTNMDEFHAKAEVYEGDMGASEADIAAHKLGRGALEVPDALHFSCEIEILEMLFCFCPLFFARYEYEGEARSHKGDSFFVLLDARTGATLAERHPPAVRALAAKLRRFLSFDRR